MGRNTHSLKWQVLGFVLACWLLPMVLILGVMAWYVTDGLGQRTSNSLTEQLAVNVRMCADRLDSAITASRTASTDPTIKGAWSAYQATGRYPALYQEVRTFFDGQFRDDNRFHFAAFWFHESPEAMRLIIYNQSLGVGGGYEQLRSYWETGYPAAAALATELDTEVGFLTQGGNLYLVRNVMSPSFQPIGTLVLALNASYYFDSFSALPWSERATLYLDGLAVPAVGEVLPPPEEVRHAGRIRLDAPEGNHLTAYADRREYALSVTALVDMSFFSNQFVSYRYILSGMVLLLIPLLLCALYFFRRKVSEPVQVLMEGARAIEDGELGHQVVYQANSLEFEYLTGSINHMSGQLRSQFEHIYQEELALRDARIKALQSHINPHFLNNTLEIINWEARMNGDAKVSKMIEALSTVLDAAVARDKKAEVTLAQEMGYVGAYLYIIDQRFGKRLQVEQDIDPATLDKLVPRLILQPVIENAVEHGIGPGGKGGIAIRSRMQDGLLLIDVENDGALSPEDEAHIRTLLAPDYDASRGPARNLGIANVNQRLRILYGGPSGLQIGFCQGRVTARLTIQPRTEPRGEFS